MMKIGGSNNDLHGVVYYCKLINQLSFLAHGEKNHLLRLFRDLLNWHILSHESSSILVALWHSHSGSYQISPFTKYLHLDSHSSHVFIINCRFGTPLFNTARICVGYGNGSAIYFTSIACSSSLFSGAIFYDICPYKREHVRGFKLKFLVYFRWWFMDGFSKHVLGFIGI